jgi:hypothetical protein
MWAQENNEQYAKAVEMMAQYIIEELDIENIEDYEDNYYEIENTASSYWREWLDDELVDAIEEKIDIAKVIDKDCYGGGGWEVERDFENDTRNKVKEIITNK